MAFKKKTEIAAKSVTIPTQVKNESTPQIEIDPVLTSFSLQKRRGYWHVVTVKTQGDKVISTEFGKPAPKAATLIQFRITVGKFLMTFS